MQLAIIWLHRDHPRIRGEHLYSALSFVLTRGSSPHSRGTLICQLFSTALIRIIPAFAGNTCCRPREAEKRWDHPRIRGEHTGLLSLSKFNPGSSPHSRGTPDHLPSSEVRSGIIPAFAGNTKEGGSGNHAYGDHPRIRGEHRGACQQTLRHKGSSPHSRGTRGLLMI